jgi:hypothetical protein
MSRLKLSVATTDYDHFRDFRLGTVQAEGIETTWSMLGHSPSTANGMQRNCRLQSSPPR